MAVAATLSSFAVPGVLGWGAAGHEIVATIAQIYTEPAALDKLCQIMNAHTGANFAVEDNVGGGYHGHGDEELRGLWADGGVRPAEDEWPCHLASVATWADKLKYRMRWSAPLHYVNGAGDHPPNTCLFPGPEGWMGTPNINVLGGIFNTSNILLDFADGELHDVGLAQEALKFIVHFFGDLHMPLHLVGRDRGGNGVDVCWEGRRTNFHSVWDNYMVAKAIRLTSYNYTRPLPGGFERVEKSLQGAIYDPFVRKIVWEGVEQKWGEELEGWIACPAGEGLDEAEKGIKGEETVWSTLRDFFMPGWFMRRSADIPLTDTEYICPYHWAKPIHALNCELIWPTEIDEDHGNGLLSRYAASGPRRPRCARFPHPHLDGFGGEGDEMEADAADGEPPYELDNPKYTGPIEERMLLEQFLAQGGVRLAAVLNYIFANQASIKRVY
ncbi:hypothetical protein D9756_008448 [Leucocoprinus leucothites]|uniref:Phospholipase C/P1 nuclease n=1 Tax=Leucocoprinus leucothites TaxID=201217 RepID=A0A8H5D1A8_9AGAR|nr:hypothetical protein D9756_008448 [Leucoagaricus leucothites]